MREIPILFSGPMVRAILAGTKTQTRRPIKPQPPEYSECLRQWYGRPDWWIDQDGSDFSVHCPFGRPGDLLWVREMWSAPWEYEHTKPSEIPVGEPVHCWADGNPEAGDWMRPRPSIHMPKWAARIWLRVTDVRVERVQDITEDDARAEGVEPKAGWLEGWSAVIANREASVPSHREEFARTWKAIYGESWDRNDWVWRIAFERCEAPAREAGR